MDSSWVLLDLETTRNPSTSKEEIIEIGCIIIDKQFEILGEFYTLVKPPCSLSYITQSKTGIREVDLCDKRKIGEVLVALLDFIKKKEVIAHNAKFDYGVLREVCRKNNFILRNIFVDSLSLLKTIFKDEKCGLISLKEKFNITRKNHRAFDDVLALKEVLFYSNKFFMEKFNRSILDELDSFKVKNPDTQKKLVF